MHETERLNWLSSTMVHQLRFLTLVVTFVLGLVQAGMGQTILVPDPPYHQKLLRLSEVLGSVHFLRNLCGEGGTFWRDAMNDLLVSERPTNERKAQLTASFNHGFRSFNGVYVRCTPSAIDALSRFMKEGAELSEDISTRYGN
jgi:uncharacterized protein (TIGR02301 family)